MYLGAHRTNMALVDSIPKAQARDDPEDGGPEVVSEACPGAGGLQGCDEVLDGLPLQRREVPKPKARRVESLGGDVAPESTPVRAVGHGAYVLVALATTPLGQLHEEGQDRAVREGVRVVDEHAVGDGRVADLVEDGRSWRCWGTPAATTDQDG